MKIIVLSFTIQKNVPLAAGYVVAAAKADKLIAKNDIQLWDEEYEGHDGNPLAILKLSRKILDANPNILAFSSYVWNLKLCIELAEIIKRENMDITIVFGGPAATFTSTYLLENYSFVDFVVRGEGEITFVELLKTLMDKTDLTNVKAISWKQKNKIIETQARGGIQNLDEVPSPYLSGILEPKKDILIETHRGCIFKCGYCQEARGYPGIRPFSVDRVEKEVEWAESRGVRRISFVNSIFNINPQRVEELSLMLAKHKNRGMQFSIDSYAMLLNEKTIELYEKAGITGTDIGLQSINRQALINMKRPWIEPEKFREKHKLLIDKGIKTSVHLIIGLPGDNFETFRQGFEFVESLEPTNIAAFKLLVLPGTPFYYDREKFQLKASNAPPFQVMSNYSFSAEEIKEAEIFAESRYKQYMMKNAYRIKESKILA
ncbi:MAG TPA: radical SAM protein [Candidatus Nanoarchaeia archaeon]|nr:radical SAM protein [Candidatus Nanoarchaeia archaeon]